MQGNSHRFWELTGGNLWRTIILPPTEHNPTLSIMSQVGIREGRWQLKRKHLLETKGRGKVSSIIWTTGIRATVEGWKLSVLSTCSTPWQTQTNSSGLNQEGKLRQQGSSSRKKKIISLAIMNKSDQESDCERREIGWLHRPTPNSVMLW